MKICVATIEDLALLSEHEKHIPRAELENCVRQGRVYMAFDGGEFVGWLRYNLFWDLVPFMNMLYMLDGRRGKGYGTQLVERWEHDMRAQGYDVVMTSTASDEYAQHFYNKIGYKTIGGFTLKDDPYEVILSKQL